MFCLGNFGPTTLAQHWRYNGHDDISNYQPHDCLLNFHSGADQRKHRSFAWLAFVRGIHRWPLNSPHKWPVTRKMFPFDDVIWTSIQRKPGISYCHIKVMYQQYTTKYTGTYLLWFVLLSLYTIEWISQWVRVRARVLKLGTWVLRVRVPCTQAPTLAWVRYRINNRAGCDMFWHNPVVTWLY